MPWWGIILVVLIVFAKTFFDIYENRTQKKDQTPDIKNGWAYNESARMWVNPEQMDTEKNRRAYEANRRTWQELRDEEARKDAEVARRKALKESLTPEERELAKQIRVARTEPTYEEWKKNRKQGDSNNST